MTQSKSVSLILITLAAFSTPWLARSAPQPMNTNIPTKALLKLPIELLVAQSEKEFRSICKIADRDAPKPVAAAAPAAPAEPQSSVLGEFETTGIRSSAQDEVTISTRAICAPPSAQPEGAQPLARTECQTTFKKKDNVWKADWTDCKLLPGSG